MIGRFLVKTIKTADHRSKSLSIRLMKMFGRSKTAVHPHHVYGLDQRAWFVPYLREGWPFLDLGSGAGSTLVLAQERASLCVGVELQDANLKVAGKLIEEDGASGIFLIKYDFEGRRLPLASGTFGSVLLQNVLEHVTERRLLLSEVNRVLVKDGVLIVTAPNSATAWKQRQRSVGLNSFDDADHKVEYRYAELVQELEDGGFYVASSDVIGYSTPLAGLIDLTAPFSPALYRRASHWKRRVAEKFPEETIGWRLVCAKSEARQPVEDITEESRGYGGPVSGSL